MLGLPPAFVLSQDQTLQFDLLYLRRSSRRFLIFDVGCFRIRQKPFNEQLLFYWLALLLNFSLIFGFHRCRKLCFQPVGEGGLYACRTSWSNFIFRIFKKFGPFCFFCPLIMSIPASHSPYAESSSFEMKYQYFITHGALRGVPAKGVGAYWRAALAACVAAIRLALRCYFALLNTRANSTVGGSAPCHYHIMKRDHSLFLVKEIKICRFLRYVLTIRTELYK